MLTSIQDIDVVCVCSPNGVHTEHSLKALEAKKHVVCEKPMALSKSRLRKIILKSTSGFSACVLCNAKPLFTTFGLAKKLWKNIIGEILFWLNAIGTVMNVTIKPADGKAPATWMVETLHSSAL